MAKAGIVYAGTDDGLVIYSDPGGIGRWRRVGQELRGHAVRSILAQSALDLLAAVAGIGLQRSTDGGQSWQPVLAIDVLAVAAHPDAPDAPFAVTTDGTIFRSIDGGQSWQHHGQPAQTAGSPPAGLLATPTTPARLFLAAGNAMLTSADSGATWEAYGDAFSGDVTCLVASPGRAGVLFAAAGGLIYRAGEDSAWQETAMFAGGPEYTIALALLPGKQEVLLAALSTRDSIMFARSDNDGANWQIARVGAPLAGSVTVIEPASYHIDTAWAGTTAGHLLRSDDRGRTWQPIAQEATAVRSLAVVRVM